MSSLFVPRNHVGGSEFEVIIRWYSDDVIQDICSKVEPTDVT